MATVALAKPGTHGTAVLQILQGDAALAKMALKLQACDISYDQITEDTTGSGPSQTDTYHTHEGSGLLGGQIALQGLLMSTKTVDTNGNASASEQWIGIQNMFSTTDNYSRMRWSIALANGIYLRGNMIVKQCRVRWVRTAATVQLTIVGVLTDTDSSTTEATAHVYVAS
jgi:hypothetical protein